MLNAIQILGALMATASSALSLAQQVSATIATAQAEGRDVTEAELNAIEGLDDTARATLADAIEKAKSA